MSGTSTMVATVISRMQERTSRQRAVNHLEQTVALEAPVEQEEFFHSRPVIVRWGSAVKASMGATRKPK